MTKKLTLAVASFLGVGYLPKCPGTWASGIAVVLAWFLPGSLVYWTICFSLAGLWACLGAREAFGADDPGAFVMDEVCGMMLAVLWLPRTLILYAVAFALFRLFDIWKPWPISRIQKSKRSWSIMGDDLLAGVFANLVLCAVLAVLVRS